jgi:amino acid adenylation domain-containing protein
LIESLGEVKMDSTKRSYPLSPMQEGILYHSITEPGTGVYVTQWLCAVEEPLEVESFTVAWEHVIARHDVLRTRFEWEGRDEPVQIVEPSVNFMPIVLDWRDLPEDDLQDRLKEFLASDRSKGIRLSEIPGFRVACILTPESGFRFLWTYHHIVVDGSAGRLIIEDLFSTYHALTEKRPFQPFLPLPYADFIAWIRNQDFSRDKAYWESVLKGYSEPTKLPELHRPVNGASRCVNAAESILLDRSLTSRLNGFARDHGLKLNILIQCAWSLLLAHYTVKDDLVFGVIRACRKSTIEAAALIAGLFINNLPIRVHLDEQISVIGLMEALQKQNEDLRKHENTPLTLIQKCSDIPKKTALYEALYIFHNSSCNGYFHAKGGRWKNIDIQEYNQNSYPITFLAFADDEILLRLEYDKRRFEEWMITRMLKSIRVILKHLVETPKAVALNLPYLSDDEIAERAAWNDTQRNYLLKQTLMDIFEGQVQRTPNAVALVDEECRLTYRELSERSNRLGRYLNKRGVGPEMLVGLFAERSPEMVVGIYGILKAGGAYVPLDPEYPADRLKFMIEDTQVPVILTQEHLIGRLPQTAARKVVLDEEWDTIAKESADAFAGGADSKNAAYVIFTSGSTGRPKGVINEHRGIVNRLLWMQEEYQLGPADRVLQKTPFSFDVSVWEFFWPLQTGARLVMAKSGGHRDSAYLIDAIRRHRITTLHFVPSMLQVFLEEDGVESCSTIQRVICSGEALSHELERRFFEKSNAELHNLYGPTEAAVDVTYWACQRGSELPVVPIGRPVANTQVYVLDSRMKALPVGVPGELFIGGVQVARGYLNRPELTKERFIPDTVGREAGGRLYRTGDLARFLPDGAIEYLGRVDYQVKIRGLRVELGEIEARLEECQGVGRCAVVLREDTPGDQRLVAYFVARADALVEQAAVREFLEGRLPDYMVPQHFVQLDGLPLTPSGKVDRRALPKPVKQRVSVDFQAPRSSAEKLVAGVWQEILDTDRVGVRDNFFDLGGHSLLVMRMVGRLRKYFPKPLNVVDVFRYPTVEQLANHLSDAKGNDSGMHRARDLAMKQREALRKQRRQSVRIKM